MESEADAGATRNSDLLIEYFVLQRHQDCSDYLFKTSF